MRPSQLTERQRHVLFYIAGYLEKTSGISPSIREISSAIGINSYGAVVGCLKALEEQGWIRRLRDRARAIEVLRDVTIPRTADGAPLYFHVSKAMAA